MSQCRHCKMSLSLRYYYNIIVPNRFDMEYLPQNTLGHRKKNMPLTRDTIYYYMTAAIKVGISNMCVKKKKTVNFIMHIKFIRKWCEIRAVCTSEKKNI